MKPILLEDITTYKFLSGLSYSPDGNNIALIESKAELKENGYRRYIYTADSATMKFKKLTDGGAEGSFFWLNNDTIVFPRVKEKEDKEALANGEELSIFYAININGGEANELFRLPLKVMSVTPIDNENLVLMVKHDLARPELEGLKPDERKKVLGQYMQDLKDFTVADELPWRFNGMGITNKLRNVVYTYNLRTKALVRVTDKAFQTSAVKLTQDKKALVITGNNFNKLNYIRRDGMYLYDLETKEMKTLIESGKMEVGFMTEVLSDKVIFSGWQPKEKYELTYSDIYAVDFNGKLERIVDLGEYDLNFGNSVGSDCRMGAMRMTKVVGDALYFLGTLDNNGHIFKLENGKIEKLTDTNLVIDSFDIFDGKFICTGMTDVTLQEVYALKDMKPMKKSGFNTKALSGRYVAPAEPVSFTNTDGYRIDGWVLKPKDFNPDKKYPAILEIHGGPHTSFGPAFFHEMQLMASDGCFVLFCNPRGGTGRGRDFYEIAGKWGDIDYKDIMEFVDECLKVYPAIDEKKLGVTGGSYGGFMTNWIIGNTDRFAAAASQRSIAEWGHFNLVGDIPGTGIREIQADIWDDFEKVYNQSPLKHVYKAKTPTMFIHSFQDYRCTQPEAEQMYRALLDNKVDTRICFFKGENHELSRSGKPKHRLRRLKEITQWLYKYIKA